MVSHPPPGPKTTSSISTLVSPTPTKNGGKTPKEMTEPHPPPTCALCDVQGHVTQNCPYFPIVCTHMNTIVKNDDNPVVNVPTVPVVKNKSLWTYHSCEVCGLYGHYSHHFPNFPEYRSLLSDLHKHCRESEIIFLEDIHPSASSSNTNNTIYTISTSSCPFPSLTVKDPPDLSQR